MKVTSFVFVIVFALISCGFASKKGHTQPHVSRGENVIIEPGAEVGADCVIGAESYIMSDAVLLPKRNVDARTIVIPRLTTSFLFRATREHHSASQNFDDKVGILSMSANGFSHHFRGRADKMVENLNNACEGNALDVKLQNEFAVGIYYYLLRFVGDINTFEHLDAVDVFMEENDNKRPVRASDDNIEKLQTLHFYKSVNKEYAPDANIIRGMIAFRASTVNKNKGEICRIAKLLSEGNFQVMSSDVRPIDDRKRLSTLRGIAHGAGQVLKLFFPGA